MSVCPSVVRVRACISMCKYACSMCVHMSVYVSAVPSLCVCVSVCLYSFVLCLNACVHVYVCAR